MANDRVVFLRPDAERIARAVRSVENGNRDQAPLRFGKTDEAKLKVLRTAYFTGSWSKHEVKTVKIQGVTDTPVTVRVGNLTLDREIGTSLYRECVIGKLTGPDKINVTATGETVSWVVVTAEEDPSVRLAVWTATTNWSVIGIGGATTTNNTKVIRLAFPTATQADGTAIVTVAGGPTAMCINHLGFIPVLSTVATVASQTILVMKEAGDWRLIGAQA